MVEKGLSNSKKDVASAETRSIERIANAVNSVVFKVKLSNGYELKGQCDSFKVQSNRIRSSHAKYTVDLPTKSIVTNDRRTTLLLHSTDYLSAEAFSTIHFEGTDLIREKSGSLTMFGQLKIKNHTQEIAVQINQVDIVVDSGNRMFERIAFRSWIDRRAWGIHVKSELAEGNLGVSHQVLIEGFFHRRTLTSN
jgi:polyisoprenoid-binding protein YceI